MEKRAVPSEALVFRFAPSLIWTVFTCSLCGFAFAGFAVVMQLTRPSSGSLFITMGAVALFGSMGAYCWNGFGRFRDRVAVSPDGIWYLSHKGDSTYVAWSDVVSASAKDTQQRLVITDSRGRTFWLEYQLTDFGKLRDFVLSHTSALSRGPMPTVFHRTWINKVILLIGAAFFLFLAGASYSTDRPWPSFWCMCAAVLTFLPISRDQTSVSIVSGAIVVKYPGWKRIIPLEEVTGISLKDESGRGNVWATVTIECKGSKPLKLYRFREGSIELKNALQAAWHPSENRT